MIKGILVTHGKFGKEILRTALRIVGKQEKVYAISNDGLSPMALREKVLRAIKRVDGESGTILFVDFIGGSCSNICKEIISGNGENLRIIAGINLPMLLDFFIYRDEYGLEGLSALLLEAGKRNIVEVSKV